MAGETREKVSGWTVDTLKAHFDALIHETDVRYEQRFNAQQQAVKDALTGAALAVDKAEANAERWRQNANEWRGAMNDRDRSFMPRPESERAMLSLDDKIATITRICVGAIFLGIAIITVVLLIVRK